MLQSFREHIKGWVAGVIFVIISSTFVLWGVQYYMESRQHADKIVAKVGSHEITLSVVDRDFQQFQMQHGFIASKQQRLQVKQSILSTLVGQLVLQQGMRDAGFVGSPEQINQALLSSAFVTPVELKLAEESVLKHSHIGYLQIPVSDFLQKVEITPKQVQAFYNDNKNQFKSPERLKLSYIQFSPAPIHNQVSITDERAEEYYQANLQNYSKPKNWTVERLVVPVDSAKQAGLQIAIADLKSKLTKSSNLKALAADNAGWQLATQKITASQLAGPLYSVLTGLKVGQVSAPIETQEGLNVFKLLSYSPATVDAFSNVKSSIKTMLQAQEVSSRLSDVNQRLSDLTYTNPESLKPAAKQLNLPISQSGWVSIDHGDGVFASAELRALAFSFDVLGQGNNSKVVTLKNGDSLVLRVLKREPSKLKPLSSVRASIVTTLKLQEAKKRAGKEALRVQKLLEKGLSGTAVAKKTGLQWRQYENTGKINQTLLMLGLMKEYNLPASMMDKVRVADKQAPPLAVLRAGFQSSSNRLGFTQLDNGDYVITQLLPANDSSLKSDLVSQRDKTTVMLEQLHSSLYVQMLVGSMQKTSKVKTYPEVLAGKA